MGPPVTTPASPPTEWKYTGAAPRLIAQVHEKISAVAGTFNTKTADGSTWSLDFGKDITYGIGGKLPFGDEVSKVEAVLRKTILVLPTTYGKPLVRLSCCPFPTSTSSSLCHHTVPYRGTGRSSRSVHPLQPCWSSSGSRVLNSTSGLT